MRASRRPWAVVAVFVILVLLLASAVAPTGHGAGSPTGPNSRPGLSRASDGLGQPGARGPPRELAGAAWNPQYSLDPADRLLLPGAQPLPAFGEPQYGVYDPLDQRIYVASAGASPAGLDVLDPSTLRSVGNLATVPYSAGLAVQPADGDLIVASGGNVSLVNPLNGSVVQRIPAPDAGTTVNGVFAFDPQRNEVVVSNEISGDANVVNLTLGRVVANLSLGYESTDAVFDDATGSLYVAGFENQSVEVINTSTWADVRNISIPGGAGLYGVALDPTIGMLYVTSTYCCLTDAAILTEVALSNDSVVRTTDLGRYPTGLVYDTVLESLIVADPEVDALEVIDPTTLAEEATVALPPTASATVSAWWIVDIPALHAIFVPGAGQQFVALVSTTNLTTVAFWDGGGELTTIGSDPACGCLAVGDPWRQRVYLVNDTTWSVVAQVGVAGAPTGFAYDPMTAELWVTLAGAFGAQGVLVLNGSTGNLEGSAAANFPAAIAWDAAADQMLVTEPFASDVLVLNASNLSVVRHVGVGSDPEGVAVDPDLNTVFVADSGGNNLTTLNATDDRVAGSVPVPAGPERLAFAPAQHRLYVTNFTEVAWLDSGSLAPEGTLPLPSASGIAVGPDGSTVAIVNGSGEVTVLNGSTGVSTPVLIGNETLAAGWSPEGSLALADLFGTLYVVGPTAGSLLTDASLTPSPSVVVAGQSLTITTQVDGGSGGLSYRYSGLPAGCLAVSGPSGDCTPTVAGTYDLEVSVVDSAGDCATAQAALWVVPAAPSYPVEVREVGLPNGSTWWFAVLEGPNVSTPSPVLTLELPNGSFEYAAAPLEPGWGPVVGALDVTGGRTLVNVSFREPQFAITFVQHGLAAGVVWSVVFPNGTSFSSAFSTINFTLPNGSFGYRIVGPADQPVTPYSGVLTVQGAAVVVNVSFAPVLRVALSANVVELDVNSTVILIATATGGSLPYSYSWQGLPPGCTGANASSVSCRPEENGTFQVDVIVADPLGVAASANLTLNVTNAPLPGSSAGTASSGWASWVVVAVAAAVAAVVLGLVLRARRPSPPAAPPPPPPQ